MAGDSHRQVVDGIETCVRTKFVEHLGVVVADRADVELLSPAAAGIHHSHIIEECALEFVDLFLAWSNTHKNLLEDEFYLKFRVVGGVESVHTVVTQAAAHSLEEVVAFLEHFDEVSV